MRMEKYFVSSLELEATKKLKLFVDVEHFKIQRNKIYFDNPNLKTDLEKILISKELNIIQNN